MNREEDILLRVVLDEHGFRWANGQPMVGEGKFDTGYEPQRIFYKIHLRVKSITFLLVSNADECIQDKEDIMSANDVISFLDKKYGDIKDNECEESNELLEFLGLFSVSS